MANACKQACHERLHMERFYHVEMPAPEEHLTRLSLVFLTTKPKPIDPHTKAR